MTIEANIRPPKALNEGQKDCLRLVMQHFSSKEIARKLALSPHTVDKRLKLATAILGVSSRVDAARIFAEVDGNGAAQSYAGAHANASAFFNRQSSLDQSGDQSLVYQYPDLSPQSDSVRYQSSAGEKDPVADKPSFMLHERQASFASISTAPTKAGFLGLFFGKENQVNGLSVPARMVAIMGIAVGSILTFAVFVSVIEGLSRLY
jgi:DNA-binding CsgD family transcriptional regulator